MVKKLSSSLVLVSLLLVNTILIASVCSYSVSSDSSNTVFKASNYAPKEVLVRFKPWAEHTVEITKLSKFIVKELRHYKFLDLSLLRIRDELTVEEALNEIRRIPSVEYAEPNYILRVDEIFPNDPLFQYQWGLHNVGQLGGIVDADIDAPEAWTITTGSDSIVVAIIDTGVDYRHIDLASNMWVNPFEIVNGVDDDDNGYVDDIYGVDTCNDDGDPMDDHGHGTAVAGVIAALGNNNLGVAGVSWHIKIMALKFADARGSGLTSDAVEAIEYVLDMKNRGVNIKITNNSWGGGGFSRALYDAIAALRSSDILFIASAGNQAQNNDLIPHYPSSYNLSNIISVAATDDRDGLAWFSNWGQLSVDLSAPGQDIITTLPLDSYGYLSGTSMAAPYVSGAAALILSINPSYNHLELKRLILSSVDEVSSLNDVVRSDGRLNLYMSLVNQGDKIKILPETISENFRWSISDLVTVKVEVVAGPNPVVDAIVTAAVKINGIILKTVRLHDDGSPPDEVKDDGMYVAEIKLDLPGKAEILITASKEGLQDDSKLFIGEVYVDLGDFPSPFIRDGTADYAIVIGDSLSHGCFNEGARTVDSLGSALVSARLGLDSEEGLPELHLDTDFTYCSNNIVYVYWNEIGSHSIIAIGGPAVNMMVYKYNDSTPFKWIYRPSYGSSIYSGLTQRTYSSVWGQIDYAVLAVLVDEDSGKTVLMVWGLTGYGTQAGTLVLGYYDRFRDMLVGEAVLLKWEDSNNNNRVDIDDTLTLIEVWSRDYRYS